MMAELGSRILADGDGHGWESAITPIDNIELAHIFNDDLSILTSDDPVDLCNNSEPESEFHRKANEGHISCHESNYCLSPISDTLSSFVASEQRITKGVNNGWRLRQSTKVEHLLPTEFTPTPYTVICGSGRNAFHSIGK